MNDASRTTRSQRLLLVTAMSLVTTIAAWLHAGGMNAVIAWDEANYAAAAELGFFANAFDSNIGDLRHEHAPLMCYAIIASTALFGGEEWAIRLPAVALSALSCGMLLIIAFDLARGRSFASRFACGLAAGLLLATSPASIEIAGVIQPHSFLVFFLLLNIWTLARFLRDLHRRDAVLFGLSLAGQFISMEYGPIVLGFALISTALARPALIFGDAMNKSVMPLPRRCWTRLVRLPRTVHRDIWLAAGACLMAIALTWPAGLFKLGAARNFTYYLLYASHGHPILFRGEIQLHVPKYAYAYWYWLDYPLLLIGMLAGLALVAFRAIREGSAVAVTLAVFTFGLALSVHASHIMQLCKSIFMIAPLVLAAPLAAAAMPRGGNRRIGSAAVGLAFAILAVATIGGGRTLPMSRDGDPNHRLIAMCRTIAEQAPANDRVLAQGWPMIRYLLHTKFNRPDIQVHRYDPRNYESDRLGPRLEAGEFAWAITIGPTASAYHDCPALARLRGQWRVVQDESLPLREYRVYHARRGHEPAMSADASAPAND